MNKIVSYFHNIWNFNFTGQDNCGTHGELQVVQEFMHLMQVGTFGGNSEVDWTVRKMDYGERKNLDLYNQE